MNLKEGEMQQVFIFSKMCGRSGGGNSGVIKD
jgi:hypothetical protein